MARTFEPAWWLPGPHLQTLWGRFFRRKPALDLRHEQVEMSDGDVVDLFRIAGSRRGPHLLLLHGLEGGIHSHYARGLLGAAAERGWSATMLAFRSCGPSLNRLARFYHSGDTADARLIAERIRDETPSRPVVAIGVSLGGNVLLRLLAELGARGKELFTAAAVISVPFDLARSSRHISRGFSRVYERYFVRSLKRKTLAKLSRFSRLPPASRVEAVRTLYDFDDLITGPIHGFENADDYYARCSSLGVLDEIRVPTLLVHAEDDPFLPRAVLTEVRAAVARNPSLQALIVPRGGHVGFVAGSPWRSTYFAEESAIQFVAAQSARAERADQVPSLSGESL